MALLWVDGFDTYGTTIGQYATPTGALGWRYMLESATYGTVRAARLGSGRSIGLGYYIRTPALTTDATLIVGYGLYIPADSAGNGTILELYDGTTRGLYLYLRMDADGEIEVWRDEGTDVLLGTTSGAAIRMVSWFYLEVKAYCHDSAGTVEIRVNGTTRLTLSGVDTKASTMSHGYWDRVQLRGTMYGGAWFDDLYICDGTGTKNNDFLGVCKVETVFPTSDAGTNQWTPQAGADHYAMVDDGALADTDATYLEDSTSSHLDQFGFGDVSSLLATVKGVSIMSDCRETDASDFTLIQRAERTSVSEGSAVAVTPKAYVTTTQEGGGGVNEFQLITLSQLGYGGFYLTFNGQTTAFIAYNASTTTVANALKALSNIGDNDVAVTGSAGAWVVEFKGAYANTNVPEMTIASTVYETHARVMDSDTEGADWTANNFDATQFGVKVG